MSKHDWFSVLITFVLGLFAGVYLYGSGFAPTFSPPEATTEDVYQEFVITAESYGECSNTNTCLSFQLLENGVFRALYDNPDSNEKIIVENKIPNSLRRELYAVLNNRTLAAESRPLPIESCYYGDQTNYYFRVTREEVNYVLDTCLSDINYEGKAWSVLTKLWNYFSYLE